MQGSEFLATYPAKLLEYALGATYLFCFLAFWRYVSGAPVAVKLAEWFALPQGLLLHPGHSWARPESDGLVTVGVDAFASRLLGPVSLQGLPALGSKIASGAQAAVAREDGREVPLVSPVEGTVVEVNPNAAWSLFEQQPYGTGWLFKVRPDHFAQDSRRLLSGKGANGKLELDWAALASRLSPQVGAVLQDGGTPVQGIARELEPERWDALCREFIHS